MTRNYYRRYLPSVMIGLLALTLLGFAGCTSTQVVLARASIIMQEMPI